VFLVTELVIGAAVLRTAGTVFGGWGEGEQGFYSPRVGDEREPETKRSRRTAVTMLVPAVALLAAGLLFGVLPGLVSETARFAAQFAAPAFYRATMFGAAPAAPAAAALALPDAGDLALSLGTCALATALAAAAMFRYRLPGLVRTAMRRALQRPVDALRLLHTGVVNDYAAWVVVGLATFGMAFALALR
jgi:multicomponent Na+:H+ antiporter subunit D